MDRKTQICKAGQQYSDSMDEFMRYHTYPRAAFIDGAEWADEHPKPDMVNKAEFIEKAKAWVKSCFTGPFDEGMANNIADEFEKYMEE